MRLGAHQVKLPFDHMRVGLTDGSGIGFGAAKSSATAIDENRPVPYKPPQLSAMARSDRGGSFLCAATGSSMNQHHRAFLIF
jgi:hypothetical protein